MRAEEIQGLMETYSKVYETPEVLSEGVIEEETQQLNEYGAGGTGGTAQDLINKRQATLKKVGGTLGAGGGQAAMAALQKKGVDPRSAYAQVYRQGEKNLDAKPAAKPAPKPAAKPGTPVAAKPTTPSAPARPTSPAKPAAAPAAAKPAATAAKPTTPAAPAKPAGSAMDQWAKANPKLAAAKAERDRTRGTSATTNPLMKDMKSSMPAPKSPAPSTASTGFGLAKKGVNLAAGVDIFDLVKGHLLDEGYADSEEGAMVIMINMSEEWRKSILESHGVEILDEISKELATKAFANRATRAFEMDDTEESGKADKTKDHIVKKYGKKAGDEAEKAAERGIFGHNKYSEAQEREQAKKKVTKEDLEAWVDQLIAEGYDLSEYTWEEVAEIYAQELELSEDQRARENPEGHDKEEKKKYEPVRGERTPMPPRGDKRREDFEKWYAKNVR